MNGEQAETGRSGLQESVHTLPPEMQTSFNIRFAFEADFEGVTALGMPR
jgi:hypothetical protein